jgi:hypothetical protein
VHPVIPISVAFVLILATVSGVTVRWSTVRARRQMTTFVARVNALPSIDTGRRAGRATGAVRPNTEARLYFLDAYRAARAKSPSKRLPRTVPALSLEHPSPARGA